MKTAKKYSNLRGELVKCGLSLETLAQKMGYCYRTLTNKFNGTTDWTLDDMKKIQQIVKDGTFEDYSMDYLFRE